MHWPNMLMLSGVFLGRAMNFFGPSLGGDRPPVDPPLVVILHSRCVLKLLRCRRLRFRISKLFLRITRGLSYDSVYIYLMRYDLVMFVDV